RPENANLTGEKRFCLIAPPDFHQIALYANVHMGRRVKDLTEGKPLSRWSEYERQFVATIENPNVNRGLLTYWTESGTVWLGSCRASRTAEECFSAKMEMRLSGSHRRQWNLL